MLDCVCILYFYYVKIRLNSPNILLNHNLVTKPALYYNPYSLDKYSRKKFSFCISLDT